MLKVISSLVQCEDGIAIMQIEVEREDFLFVVMGSALQGESGRYVELAQARALLLARQLLEQGLDAVNPDDYLTTSGRRVQSKAKPAASTPMSPSPAPTSVPSVVEPAVAKPAVQPDLEPPVELDTPADPSDFPDVPW